ncbi:sensor histidine kinase [Caenimonas aquaedulcis]|uniref:histidine kinase n=1 Tax=Caenimonas aquaedulcis TaxID=2793270 RepID=A0A931MHS4_9BURK|nr:PAS domain S-box protein [Caenimonas aquaedulcis]MBG9389118.1 PAS domain S-box protein [Caenimonas aquaedulcis]
MSAQSSSDASSQAAQWLDPLGRAIDEMMWAWSPVDGWIVYTNPAFERFWGVSAKGLPHGHDALIDRMHPEDRERMRRARDQLPEAGYSDEFRTAVAATADRPARTARIREQAFVANGPAGQPYVVHVARDVSWQFDTSAQLREEASRRTDAERSLNDATQRMQALIASANDAVITIDEKSSIVDWNEAAERMFGFRRDEALGKRLTDMIIPVAFRKHHDEGIARFLRDGTAPIFNRRVETLALRRSGEEFHAELSIWPVKTGEGYTFSSFIRDISRRKANEKALAESEAKYRKVVENVNEGILVTAGGRILYANPRALQLTGMDDETAKSKPFIEFIHPDDRERVLGNHTRRLKGEPVENHYQFRVIHANGDTRWLEISAVLFEWQNTPATLNFLTDVTERRQAEQDMRTALARERELSELKSRFVAVASHEFRTPLAAILSSIELLDDYGPRLPEGERKEIVGLIKNAVARMNKMVEQVLVTSRLESGRFRFEPQARNIPQLLVQVAAEMDQSHEQASRITMQCEGADQPRMVDAKLVSHILVNLLGNALKYSPPDTPVTCVASADGDRLRFSITDRGIGIPPADLPRLFESFHRGTNVGNIQGTGIGLHIVKECVELHRGSIDVRSEPGEGTTFEVRLHAPPAS